MSFFFRHRILSGYDGRPYDRVAGFRVQGQPCVWCGGQACTGNNENLCFLPQKWKCGVIFLVHIHVWNFNPWSNRKDGMRDDRPSCIHGWFSQRDVKPGVFCGVACFLKSKIHHFQHLPTVSGTVPNNGFGIFLWGFAPANVMCRLSWVAPPMPHFPRKIRPY